MNVPMLEWAKRFLKIEPGKSAYAKNREAEKQAAEDIDKIQQPKTPTSTPITTRKKSQLGNMR